jgi:hypothetical protein
MLSLLGRVSTRTPQSPQAEEVLLVEVFVACFVDSDNERAAADRHVLIE